MKGERPIPQGSQPHLPSPSRCGVPRDAFSGKLFQVGVGRSQGGRRGHRVGGRPPWAEEPLDLATQRAAPCSFTWRTKAGPRCVSSTFRRPGLTMCDSFP